MRRRLLPWTVLSSVILLLLIAGPAAGTLASRTGQSSLQTVIAPSDYGFRWPLDEPRRYWTFGSPVTMGVCAGGLHNGVDYHVAQGAEVHAVYDGIVELSSDNSAGSYGWWIVIRHELPAETVWSLYAHLQSEALYKEGEEVKKGWVIGYEGKTGAANDIVHLHFELRKRWNPAIDKCPYSEADLIHFYDPDEFIGGTPPSPSPPNIAVTTPYFDDIGSILDQMGDPWNQWTQIQDSDLANYNFISQFDVIFANCNPYAYDHAQAATNSLRQFVQNGGSLYASDWAFVYVDAAFPGYIDFPSDPYIGMAQSVTARITDPGLASYLDPASPPSTVDLNYNLGAWVIIDSVAADTKVHLRGSFDTYSLSLLSGDKTRRPGIESPQPSGLSAAAWMADRPLLVSFRYGNGQVVYTTFHNEAQQGPVEQKLIRYLILMPATTELQLEVEQVVAAGSAQLRELTLNSIAPGQTSSLFNFMQDVVSNLLFVFHWGGSTLRVDVYKPDGSLYAAVESSWPPIVIPVRYADPGTWKYQVTAIDVPYDNYPYAAGIGGDVLTYLPIIMKNY